MTDCSESASSDLLALLLGSLPYASWAHAPGTPLYELLSGLAKREVQRFRSADPQPVAFHPFGEIVFPYLPMGAISSLHLFGLDELILFSFYRANRDRYQRVADLGANIGLHSLVLDRCGFEVCAYEPDPDHYALLQKNLALNSCSKVSTTCAAVSIADGEMEFTRVLGNTTSSHLTGAKSKPYGDLERFAVSVKSIGPILEWADLVKMDVEGHEAAILLAVDAKQLATVDIIVEIGTYENAKSVYSHLRHIGAHVFAQKNNWREVLSVKDMPYSYRDGSLFITSKTNMPWL